MVKRTKIKLDPTDLAILNEIQENSRISNNELARRINLSQPAAHTRLKRLHRSGVIQKFTARLNYEPLGYELICFFQTRLRDHSEADIERFEKTVTDFPEILECHYLTGEFDHLIKAVFQNRRDLEHFLRNRLSTIPGVSRIITSLVLSEIKTGSSLPLPANKEIKK